MAGLTRRTLEAAKPGKWLSDEWAKGGGAFIARREGDSLLFYFRYTRPDGGRDIFPLGAWEGMGGPLSLEAARRRARELSARYRAGDRDLRAVLHAEEREAQRGRADAARALEEATIRQQATLGVLLDAYVADLRRKGKGSADEVAGTIRRHVTEPWPKLAAKPANDVTTDDLLAIVARVVEGGKLRQAAKLRSHLQAAYNTGIKARQSATAGADLRALKVTSNPARDLATVEGGSATKDRALSVSELRAYWRRIRALPDQEGAALRFHLLTGGQRVAQLARAVVRDIDHDAQAVRLWDGKGRRANARAHVVPLIAEAQAAMDAMAPARAGDFLFTVTAGQSGIHPTNLRDRLVPVVDAMEAAGELPGGRFTLGDLRRTVETRLAAAGVSKDIRGRVQSHGLGGVQDRHYDRHDYLPEIRAALDTLFQIAAGEGADVIPLQRRRPA